MKSLLLALTLIIIFSNIELCKAQTEPRNASEKASTTKKFDFADNKKGTSMMPIMGDALPVIKYIEDTLKVEIVRLEYDLIFDKKVTYRTLYKGWKYGIVVIGDYRVKQINVNIYKKVNDKWDFVISSTSDNYLAMANVELIETGDYLFQVVAEKFAEGYKAGHYAIIVYH
ncbi:MAG: hypothetical protein B6I20_03395 [Bacteroidetes bacterium 4572_117]|nr:MAG: hypothetical protein B6I20_03395 [Bacteroidetes bacterium 4572_117]